MVGVLSVGAVLCAGCGSSTTTACGADVPAAVAAAVGAHAAEGKAQEQSSGYAVCEYKATSPRGGAPEGISVTVQDSPRAYVGFTTMLTHLVQFPSVGQSPQDVPGVGKSAVWLSGPRKLLAATATRFVIVKVLAHGAHASSDIQSATRVARASLR